MKLKVKKTLTQLKKLADKLFQEKYTKGNCLSCGRPAECVHHYIPKGRSNYLRYCELNAVPICRGCHTKHHLSGDPDIIHAIDEKIGPLRVSQLQLERFGICKFTKGYLEEVIKNLTE